MFYWTLPDYVVGRVVDATAAEHEAVHAHAEVLTIRLETLPDKHAGAGNTGHLAWPGGDLVTICNTNTESDTGGSG